MSIDPNQITLIIPASSSHPNEHEDRGGGEQHGLKEGIYRLTSKTTINSEKLSENLKSTLSQVDKILSIVGKTLTSEWKVESIAVGLSITAEGSIGIATAGVETSIEISFSPKE
jgi:hypothetical protein